ncbi:hypothetical protein A4U98_07635 [Bifidobacterium animalis subsp. animalis]|nr:hypothetical protein A4U98_07635 [Bifidobacterium animalis subsp. animalis]PHQ54079.1 hypothetical protein ADH71_007950 [Bifidobacterium animalis subsp. animalis]
MRSRARKRPRNGPRRGLQTTWITEKPTQYAAHLRNSAGNRTGSISQQTLRMLYISLKHYLSTI